MKWIFTICLLFIFSCTFRTGYYTSIPPATPVVYNYQPIVTLPLYYRPFRYFTNRQYNLGNVYNNYYQTPRVQTNLPLNFHSGPRGGRRK